MLLGSHLQWSMLLVSREASILPNSRKKEPPVDFQKDWKFLYSDLRVEKKLEKKSYQSPCRQIHQWTKQEFLPYVSQKTYSLFLHGLVWRVSQSFFDHSLIQIIPFLNYCKAVNKRTALSVIRASRSVGSVLFYGTDLLIGKNKEVIYYKWSSANSPYACYQFQTLCVLPPERLCTLSHSLEDSYCK